MLYRAMDHCCYDCPVANCTVNELLRHIKNSCDNCTCTNGTGAIVAALIPPYIIFGVVIPVIIAALLFYHFVYKKKHDQLYARLRVASFFTGHCNICKRKSRSQSDRPDCRSDQQNRENSNGAEGITYDAVNNEARATAPEMKRNQAYARGMTHGQM